LELLKQESPYDCVVTSVAMCMNTTPEDLKKDLTHNPDEIIWAGKPGVRCLRGIQIEDLLPIIWSRNYYAMPFFKKVVIQNRILTLNCDPPLFMNGILMYEDIHHVVAWNSNNQQIYDPRGEIYDLRDNWVEFWVITRRELF